MVVGNIFIGMIGGQPAYNCGSASSNAGAQATATAQAQATATAQAQATATPTPARQVAVIGKYPGYLQYQNDPRYDLFNIDTNGMTDLAIRAANTAWVLGHTNARDSFLVVSDPNDPANLTQNGVQSYFGIELALVQGARYKWRGGVAATGNFLDPP